MPSWDISVTFHLYSLFCRSPTGKRTVVSLSGLSPGPDLLRGTQLKTRCHDSRLTPPPPPPREKSRWAPRLWLRTSSRRLFRLDTALTNGDRRDIVSVLYPTYSGKGFPHETSVTVSRFFGETILCGHGIDGLGSSGTTGSSRN